MSASAVTSILKMKNGTDGLIIFKQQEDSL